MEKEIMVSIVCDAYNHEKYIAQCLDGFIMQKTNFPFEVLIHDDASTDRTAEIIREYEKKYPEIIKPVYQTVNQYTRGGTERFQYPRAKGKYIAMCEGDDYWTDPLKLQKQFDAMEANPDVDICTHAAIQWDELQDKEIARIAPRNENTIIPVEDVIWGNGGFVATNSIFYRTELEKRPQPFREVSSMDYALQINGSLRGGMLYLNDCMSVYRYQTAGSWTLRTRKNPEKLKAHVDEIRRIMDQVERDSNGKYSEMINWTMLNIEFVACKEMDDYKGQLDPKFKPCMAELSKAERAKIYLKAYFPILWKMKDLLVRSVFRA